MNIRPTSLLRAAGPAAAVALPWGSRRRARALATGSSYAASAAIDPQGISFLSVSLDDERLPGWVNRAALPVTATASWVAVQQVLVPVVRRLPLNPAVAGVMYAGLLYLADHQLATLAQSAQGTAQPSDTATD